MGAAFKIKRGDFEIQVFQKSFKVVKFGVDGDVDDTTPFIFCRKQIDKDEAKRYLKGLMKFWQNLDPRPLTISEMVQSMSTGHDIHCPVLQELPYVGYSLNIISSADFELCETLAKQLGDHPTWEPEAAGESARQDRAAHLYAMLNEAYKQGRAAAKVAAADAIADLIMRA